jgi:hypothetical protein
MAVKPSQRAAEGFRRLSMTRRQEPEFPGSCLPDGSVLVVGLVVVAVAILGITPTVASSECRGAESHSKCQRHCGYRKTHDQPPIGCRRPHSVRGLRLGRQVGAGWRIDNHAIPHKGFAENGEMGGLRSRTDALWRSCALIPRVASSPTVLAMTYGPHRGQPGPQWSGEPGGSRHWRCGGSCRAGSCRSGSWAGGGQCAPV